MTIQELNPKSVWQNFHALTRVPRPSGHLEKVQQFLLQWAAERGIEAWKDGGENIVMRVPATPGMEDRPTAVMQAHMDMVPQKGPGSAHDFVNDPIETRVEGDWLYATNTTLGADDGIGVAIILATLEAKDLPHGPLEALITSDEETCMYGVNHLDADTLTGKILLNIDNEQMGQFVIGSAGGINITATMEYKAAEAEAGDVALKVTVTGLLGGHSGLEIGLARGNANKLMARLVQAAIAQDEARLAQWNGGNMRNAIPREAEVIITVPAENEEDVRELCTYCQGVFAEELRGIDDGLQILVECVEAPAALVPEDIQDNLVNAILACHDGVLRYIPSIPGVVETSSNLAIVAITPEAAKVLILARSSNDNHFEYEKTMIESCFSMVGMKVEYSGAYGSWQPRFGSPIVDKMSKIYKEMFGEDADVNVCHAGLECSLIGAVYPEMDMVSMGPTIESPHTPNERCLIPTVEQFWSFFRELIQSL
ncbi:MAG: aminoacyl-histidine dipeptidase [Bacteroidaceae bacterium]|nr:aminoacyl-histidine dipeptidase [Bacteroidaceae bacterium]